MYYTSYVQELVKSPHTEQAASGLSNPTHLDGVYDLTKIRTSYVVTIGTV